MPPPAMTRVIPRATMQTMLAWSRIVRASMIVRGRSGAMIQKNNNAPIRLRAGDTRLKMTHTPLTWSPGVPQGRG